MITSTLPTDPTPATGLDQLIAIRPGYCGGKPHIAGHRIKVQHVAVWHLQLGQSPEEIVATYPTIDLAQVHAALAYYFSHREAIDADVRADEEFIADLRAKGGPTPLENKLRDRHAQDDPLPPG